MIGLAVASAVTSAVAVLLIATCSVVIAYLTVDVMSCTAVDGEDLS